MSVASGASWTVSGLTPALPVNTHSPLATRHSSLATRQEPPAIDALYEFVGGDLLL